jgi:signal transduction histidine kinase
MHSQHGWFKMILPSFSCETTRDAMMTNPTTSSPGFRSALPAAIHTLLVALVMLFGIHSVALAAETSPSAEVVAFVQKAVALVEQEGEDSFAKFRQPDSKWFHGNEYLFIWGLDGMRYVYPPDTSGEGQNMLNLKDINGKPIGRWFVARAANPPGHGWVHYQWPRPGDIFPSWKSTYIQRAVAPSGKNYLVGAGRYNMPFERAFLVELVDNAGQLLVKEGKAGYDRLRDRSDEFIFMDAYIFLLDAEGTEIVNPAFPNLEGRNLIDHKDAAGKLLVKEMLDRTRDGNSAWVEYYWARPGTADQVRKLAYVKRVRVDGEDMVIGAGMYEP